jgi:hypothetical protein
MKEEGNGQKTERHFPFIIFQLSFSIFRAVARALGGVTP